MDHSGDLPHRNEQIIKHDISDSTLKGGLVHGEQIGDQVDRAAGEQKDEVSLWDSRIHPAPAASKDATSAALYDRASTLSTRFLHSGRREDLEEAILLHRQALELRPVAHPRRSMSLNSLALALRSQFEQLGREKDLKEAILLNQQALDLRPASHPDRATSLNNLATAIFTRFTQSGRQEDLDEAILLNRQALELRTAPHPDRNVSLTNLASDLRTRFTKLGRREDIQEAITLHRQALELLPESHPNRSMSLSILALALYTQFVQFGGHENLEDAILLHRNGLKLLPESHHHRSKSLTNLAIALWTRFTHWGRREDMEEAILLYQQTLKLLPATHADRSITLGNLALALQTRFTHLGQLEDLEGTVLLSRQALELLPASHPHRPIALGNFAFALRTRFTQSGRREDLYDSIVLHREALQLLPAYDSNRCIFLNKLATSLWIQFAHSGRRDDLEEAILLYREALDLLPASHYNRSRFLDNLANPLVIRFLHSGRREDVDEAITLRREALELIPASHPSRSMFLNCLASALGIQIDHPDRREYLEKAIVLNRQALELLSTSHPYRSQCLTHLALTLWARFMHVTLLPASQPDTSMFLDNLVSPLGTQFTHSGLHEDLEEVILLYREALELHSASHPPRSSLLNNLANALATRFKHSGLHDDLEEAINLASQSLDALVGGHPSTCIYSHNQGNIFFMRYIRTKESKYLHKVMHSFQVAVACEAAPASLRFEVAKRWASLADCRHESALDAYHAAIQLLPRLAMLGLDLPSRQQALTSGSDGLARDAAACAIRSGQYDKAVELLEEGRAVFWSQALQLRTPMNNLREVAPELEDKLRRISLALEQGSLRDVSRSLSDDRRRVMSMEQEASHFRRLNDEWLEVVEKVRHLEGFQDFLRPRGISTLLDAASKAPLVILNASHTGCAALILTSTGVQHVPFPDLTFSKVARLVDLVQIVTTPGGRDSSLAESDRARIEDLVRQMQPLSDNPQPLKQTLARGAMTRVSWSDVTFRYVLAILWESVVEPVVRHLGFKKSKVPSNLWWCPTGPFSLLPIHAAGMYDIKEPVCVSDYLVSSYTPTISALLRDTPLPPTPCKMVVVIQPELRNTIDELQRIEARVSVTNAKTPIVELVKIESGTVEEVASHLPTASIIHFACHGAQHAQKPLESALVLKDRPLTVYQIMQQSSPNAILAFLAACQTAMGDKTLPDEMIHLGSTLLFAGFPGVIATMWNISDVDGPGVADTFYEYLFKEPNSDTEATFQPDTTRAARALHLAVAKLRSEKNISFARWVPFIHLGM